MRVLHNSNTAKIKRAIRKLARKNVILIHGEASRYAFKLENGMWLTLPYHIANNMAGLGCVGHDLLE